LSIPFRKCFTALKRIARINFRKYFRDFSKIIDQLLYDLFIKFKVKFIISKAQAFKIQKNSRIGSIKSIVLKIG
jgi:hypothetical protein